MYLYSASYKINQDLYSILDFLFSFFFLAWTIYNIYSNFSLCLSNQPDYTHQALAYMYKYAKSARLYLFKAACVFRGLELCGLYILIYRYTSAYTEMYIKNTYIYI